MADHDPSGKRNFLRLPSRRETALGLITAIALSPLVACGNSEPGEPSGPQPSSSTSPDIEPTTDTVEPTTSPSVTDMPSTEPIPGIESTEPTSEPTQSERVVLYDWSFIDHEKAASWDEMSVDEKNEFADSIFLQVDPEIPVTSGKNLNEVLAIDSKDIVDSAVRKLKIAQDAYNDGETDIALKIAESISGYTELGANGRKFVQSIIEERAGNIQLDPECLSYDICKDSATGGSLAQILYSTSGNSTITITAPSQLTFVGRAIAWTEDFPNDARSHSPAAYFACDTSSTDTEARWTLVYETLDTETPFDYGDGNGPQSVEDILKNFK